MTPEQAIEQAIKSVYAALRTAIAAELRAQSTSPQLPPEDPAQRLTLHDVTGNMCSEGRIAITRRVNNGGRWMHVDDHSACEHTQLVKGELGWEFPKLPE